MSNALNRLSYALSQKVRTAWFGGHYAVAARTAPPIDAAPAAGEALPSWRAIGRDLDALFQWDWANIEAGHYKAPHDMWPNPAGVMRQSMRFFRDLGAVNRRKRERAAQEVFAPPHRGRYPRYYLQNFHYQSEGYLSPESARLYDYQVEVLFNGGADAMRRQLLVPICDYFDHRPVRAARLLDVACGTGRFLTFVKDNYPRLAVSGIDLSGPYLAQAARHLRHWSRVGLAAGNAETLPFGDGAFDLVTCIYLFHELPRAVRRVVARELARVVMPGGLLLVMDSIQRDDHPPYNPLLDRFPLSMHEPYFADYVVDDLDGMFRENGFEVVSTERVYFSRMMVLRRC
jgi:ubiquinone/menaquinone biosynthesis C-methylase UbiE